MTDKPPSQGKVEISEDGICWTCKCGWRSTFLDLKCPGCGNGQPAIYAAITQALTESSGQGTDGAEAMREAARLARNFLVSQEVEYEARGEVGMWRKVMAKLDNALALPVSADGSVTVPEALLSTCLGVLREMNKRCAVTGEDWESDYTLVVSQLKRFINSKQPSDTGAG